MQLNFWAILVCGVLSMALGAIWYGPLFGKKWMEIVGVKPEDIEARKKMRKAAGPLYVVQFLLTLFQVYILQFVIVFINKAEPDFGGLFVAMLLYAGFIIPSIAGSAMWNNDKNNVKWAKFLIQGGYQLALFIVFGMVLGAWN